MHCYQYFDMSNICRMVEQYMDLLVPYVRLMLVQLLVTVGLHNFGIKHKYQDKDKDKDKVYKNYKNNQGLLDGKVLRKNSKVANFI